MQDITEWGIVMSMFPYLLFILTATFDLKFKKRKQQQQQKNYFRINQN
jgi:hypothetical protein